jgi:3-hydroxyisobutyrate dehydrogenase-like beta-hydroxyacid dehydrogenase
MATTIGILHPGEMGAAVARSGRQGGSRVCWASEGRRAETRRRAEAAGLADVGTLSALVAQSDLLLSVCPPHAALDLARSIARLGFSGLYVDANAVAPATAREIGTVVEGPGATFVDGGIVGPPPERPGTTRLYLSGAAAARVAQDLGRGSLEAIVLGGPPGAASALKMAYAAWTKGSAALLLAVRALAVAEAVDDALREEWRRSLPDLAERSEAAAHANARKAWRFVGEMKEIACTFAAAGLPAGFHRAAADVYQRLAGYRDVTAPPTAHEVAGVLLGESASTA